MRKVVKVWLMKWHEFESMNQEERERNKNVLSWLKQLSQAATSSCLYNANVAACKRATRNTTLHDAMTTHFYTLGLSYLHRPPSHTDLSSDLSGCRLLAWLLEVVHQPEQEAFQACFRRFIVTCYLLFTASDIWQSTRGRFCIIHLPFRDSAWGLHYNAL